MAVTQEPILSRLDRLDNVLRELEEIRIRGGNRSPKSSCASTPSSGTLTSEGLISSIDLSPNSLEKRCRPIGSVMMETEVKGTLVERLDHVEERVLKLCVRLEGELEAERSREVSGEMRTPTSGQKKGLKGLVKRIVKGNSKKHTDRTEGHHGWRP